MKKVVIVILFYSVVGCSYSIHKAEINKAKELCENNGGIKYITVSTVSSLVCINGAVFRAYMDEVKK